MRIIPVLDLKDGCVVRGVGGRRDEYQPVVSCLTASHQPLDVANAFHRKLGLSELYVADLDAISSRLPPNRTLYSSPDFQLWVDAGIQHPSDAQPLIDAAVHGIVAGLETISGPNVLRVLLEHVTTSHILFSLDLQHGQPLGNVDAWKSERPLDIASQAIDLGIDRVLILDLARVGEAQGIGTETLCEQLARRHPHVELFAGGGIRHLDDLQRLAQSGVSAALVASALHDGRIHPQSLSQLNTTEHNRSPTT